VVGSPGFEPGSRTPEALNWDGFEEWLLKSHGKDTARLIMRYARRYYWILWSPEKAGVLLGESKGIRRNTMIALSNLSKYLGVYESWKTIVKNYGLKWEKRTGLETVLSLLTVNLEGIIEWLLMALRDLPRDYRVVLVFQALTGLRPSEAVESCRLVRSDLENYLNRDLMALEHWRYPEIFLRRTKNTYISFVDEDLINPVLEAARIPPKAAIKSALRKRRMPQRMIDLRRLYATTLRNAGIPRESIDFLQGRVGQSVFMMYYYKPYLLELRKKVQDALKPLRSKILEAF